MKVSGCKKLVFLALFLSSISLGQVVAQQPKPNPPTPPQVQPTPPSPQENLAWHRWQTTNFVVLSLNQEHGAFLVHNIERVKSWVLTRWGFPDIKFNNEFRVICVPNKDYLKKFFKIDYYHFEARTDQNGKKLNVAWFSMDENPQDVVARVVTEVALREFKEQYGVKLGVWAYRGMGLLNCPSPAIRSNFATLQATSMRGAKELFEMTEESFNKLTTEDRRKFDTEAAAMCLLLRKEFGPQKFVQFLVGGANEMALGQTYGFQGYGHFDMSFKRYTFNLAADIMRNVTPDSYLQVN